MLSAIGRSLGTTYSNIVQGSYVRALLWEYAATLGMVEISYTLPEDAVPRLHSIYGFDDDYISRYDGLLGFRLTNLGAYVLGLTEEYIPTEEVAEVAHPSIVVLPNLDIVVTDASRVTARDRAFLRRIGASQSEDVYHISREMLLDFAEAGATGLDAVKKFLTAKSGVQEADFPQTVRVFFADTEKRLNAVRNCGRMLVLKGDEYVLTELAHTRTIREMVQLGKVGGETVLLVPEEQEEAVRKQMKKMGYVPRKG